MLKINFKKVFKRRLKKESFLVVGFQVVRDWKIVVLSFAVLVLAVSLLSWRVYLSNKIGGGFLESESVITEATVRGIDENKLNSSLNMLENKKSDYENLKVKGLQAVDPSL